MVGQRPDNSQTDDWPDNLIGKHRQMLIDSGISAATAKARGYETIKDPRRLAAIGIPKNGQRTMGVQIPLRTFDGSVWGYQYRPDSPREVRGSPQGQHRPAEGHDENQQSRDLNEPEDRDGNGRLRRA